MDDEESKSEHERVSNDVHMEIESTSKDTQSLL